VKEPRTPTPGPASFDGVRLTTAGIVVAVFLADWCPFCRSFRTEILRFAAERRWKLLVADLTSEESPLWDRFHVEIVPTVVVFRDGEAVFRRDGVAGRGLGPTDLAAIGRAVDGEVGRGAGRGRKPSA